VLRIRFELACKRLGYRHRGMTGKLDTTLFRKPAQPGRTGQGVQLSLL
jgi:hypothetical protein